MSESYEVIVIGSGAGGATLARPGFFPSIGAVNPAPTAMANALRVGQHIADRIS